MPPYGVAKTLLNFFNTLLKNKLKKEVNFKDKSIQTDTKENAETVANFYQPQCHRSPTR